MHFGDERYVRLYTRDTLTWLSLGWEGQAALALLMRKVDRAGVLEIDDRTAEEAISAVTGLPTDICGIAWPRLSTGKDPTVTLRDETSRALVIPRFLDAQEAIATDKARAQKLRETRRAVTRRDEPSQCVTKRHARSRGVTPSRTVLSRTEEDDLDPKRSADPAARAPEPAAERLPNAKQGDQPEPWPRDVYDKAQKLLAVDDLDPTWQRFIGDCIREKFSVAARTAGVLQLEREGKRPGEVGPGLLREIIRRFAKAQNGNGTTSGQPVVAPAAKPRWQEAGFKSEAEYQAKIRETAEANGGSEEAWTDAVHEVRNAG